MRTTERFDKMAAYASFNGGDYLRTRYSDISAKDRVQFQLDKLHDFFHTFSSTDCLKVLDFGCGPVIQHSISAAAYASEIVFSDIASSCREAIKKWLTSDPDAFNWSPHFDYVVQSLEGKGEHDSRAREEELRKKVKGVVYCDVLSDSPMESGFEGPYDVILEVGCFQAASKSITDYKKAVKNAYNMLQLGGYLVQRGVDLNMDQIAIHYRVDEQEFTCLCITHQYAVEVMKEIGFSNVSVECCPVDPLNTSDYNKKEGMIGYFFVKGQKCK